MQNFDLSQVLADLKPGKKIVITIEAVEEEDNRPRMNLDDIIKMKKRVRQRWARSHVEHPEAPKTRAARKRLRMLATDEWKYLERYFDFRISVNQNNERRLVIESPDYPQ